MGTVFFSSLRALCLYGIQSVFTILVLFACLLSAYSIGSMFLAFIHCDLLCDSIGYILTDKKVTDNKRLPHSVSSLWCQGSIGIICTIVNYCNGVCFQFSQKRPLLRQAEYDLCHLSALLDTS